MRIIAGKAGRVAIKVPSAVARPTTDFVRQAIYSILAEAVEDARVLDLFCGSGALGLEALSRGAASCVFVDEHRQAIAVTEENLKKSQLQNGRCIKADVFSFLARDTSAYDLIFADPPYWKGHGDTDLAAKLLATESVANRLAPNGYLVVEISSAQPSPTASSFRLLSRREYGSSAILIFTREVS